jgi:hypothetical protein
MRRSRTRLRMVRRAGTPLQRRSSCCCSGAPDALRARRRVRVGSRPHPRCHRAGRTGSMTAQGRSTSSWRATATPGRCCTRASEPQPSAPVPLHDPPPLRHRAAGGGTVRGCCDGCRCGPPPELCTRRSLAPAIRHAVRPGVVGARGIVSSSLTQTSWSVRTLAGARARLTRLRGQAKRTENHSHGPGRAEWPF